MRTGLASLKDCAKLVKAGLRPYAISESRFAVFIVNASRRRNG